MLIEYNPDEWETVSESHTCLYHKKNPGKSYAGCTCGGSHGMRRKDPYPTEKVDRESLARIKALCGTQGSGNEPLMDIVDRHLDEHAEVFKRLPDSMEEGP